MTNEYIIGEMPGDRERNLKTIAHVVCGEAIGKVSNEILRESPQYLGNQVTRMLLDHTMEGCPGPDAKAQRLREVLGD